MQRTLISIAVAAALATGCASAPAPIQTKKPYPDKPDTSTALEMMHAAGIQSIRDANPKKLDQNASGAQVDDTRASVLTAAAFGAGDAIAAPAGVSPGLMGLLGFSWWLNTGKINPAKDIRVIGWVPADAVDSPQAAYKRFHGELRKATQATIKRFELDAPYRFKAPKHDKANNRRIWPVAGGDCDKAFHCRYWYQYMPWGLAEETTAKAYAPAVLGGYRAYTFTDGRDWPRFKATKAKDKIVTAWVAGLPDLQFYRRLSQRLPEWMALYLAPEKVSFRGGPKSKYKWDLNKLPFILHQGHTHQFIAGANRAPAGDAGA